MINRRPTSQPVYPTYAQPQPQPQLPPMAQPQAQYVTPVDFRRGIGALEQQLAAQLAGFEQRLAMGERLIAERRSGLGEATQPPADTLNAFQLAVKDGRVAPYIYVVNIPIDAGTVGEKLKGQSIPTGDGPVLICGWFAYAQIDTADENAQNFPWSLLPKPSCNAECGEGAFDDDDASATLEIDFGNELLAGIDARGMFIPISQRECKLVSYGREVVCATLTCPDETEHHYSAVVPLVMFDHPDCISGLVDIQVNSCGWQNVQYPLDFFDENWSLTQQNPDSVPFGGYLDCQKIMDVSFTPTRAPKFDTLLSFVFAGFRIITCGAGACGVG